MKRRGPAGNYRLLKGEVAPNAQRLRRRFYLALMIDCGVDDAEAAKRFNAAFGKNIREEQVREWRESRGPMFAGS